MELHCICERTRLFSLFINPDETAKYIQHFHYMSNVKHGSRGEAKAVMLQLLFTFFFLWSLNTILSSNPSVNNLYVVCKFCEVWRGAL